MRFLGALGRRRTIGDRATPAAAGARRGMHCRRTTFPWQPHGATPVGSAGQSFHGDRTVARSNNSKLSLVWGL